jgi:hypothetical protein
VEGYISKNKLTEMLIYVIHFIQNGRNTNVVIMRASHRFDLQKSHINKEEKVFNRKLQEI